MMDILLSKTTLRRPWDKTPLSVPRIIDICGPGKYYVELSDSPYCTAKFSEVITTPSIRCAPCPPDTYSSETNQKECDPCPYGTFSEEGSTLCKSCDDAPENVREVHDQCIIYIKDKATKRRRIFIGIFVPVGVIVVAALIGIFYWRYRKYRKVQSIQSPSQATWLLSYDELMRPSMQHMNSLPSPNSVASEAKADALSPSAAPLLGTEETNLSAPASPQNSDNTQATTIAAGEVPSAMLLASRPQQLKMSENGDKGELQHVNRTESTTDYFNLATVRDASS